MPTVANRSGGNPNESIQTANALGKLIIGTSSTPVAPVGEQSASTDNPSAPASPSPASTLSNALKQVAAAVQTAIAGNAQQPGAWSEASPELTALLDKARGAFSAGSPAPDGIARDGEALT